MENLDSLAGLVQSRRDQLGTLLTNVNTVRRCCTASRPTWGRWCCRATRSSARPPSARTRCADCSPGFHCWSTARTSILADEPELDALLKNMSEFATMMADHDSLLRDLLQTAPITIRNLTNATGNGNDRSEPARRHPGRLLDVRDQRPRPAVQSRRVLQGLQMSRRTKQLVTAAAVTTVIAVAAALVVLVPRYLHRQITVHAHFTDAVGLYSGNAGGAGHAGGQCLADRIDG